MNKRDVADLLREIAVLLELKGENPFKARAYVNGARALENLEGDVEAVVASGKLVEVPGVGEALASKVAELVKTGRLEYLERLRAEVPPGFRELLELGGLGPKKIRALHSALGVDSVPALAAACVEGRVAELEGFGEKTQAKLLEAIRHRAENARRHLWWDAEEVAAPLVEGLRALPGVERAEAAGSLRRGLETVGDLDFIVAAADAAPVMYWFTTRPGVREVLGRGETKASVRYEGGLQADLRVVPAGQFAFALHHFTGSKDHNVQLRQRALARGWSLGEWGLASTSNPAVEPPACLSEEELFAFLGLAPIPPELREGLGEIAAAEQGRVPELVTEADLRGVFHNHTTESDGRSTLEEMVAAADARGWEYIGIADHSRSSFQARGLDVERLRRQVEAIRKLNASGRYRCQALAGSEVDILPDGSLDFPDEVLAELEYVVASVHSAFQQDEATMTARIERAVRHPRVRMLGHPTGRLLLRREGYRVDLSHVIAAAAEAGTVIELNCSPERMELDWRYWREAAAAGVLTSINPDAHEAEALAYVRMGVLAARKGGLSRASVVNTRGLAEVRAWLAAPKR